MATSREQWAALDARASQRAAGVGARGALLARGERAPKGAPDIAEDILIAVVPAGGPARVIDLTDVGPEDDAAWLSALTRRLTPRV
jgi:hypothetical protein